MNTSTQMIASLFADVLEVNAGDQKRIEHTVKVHNYAKQIGQLESLSDEQMMILEITALLHDIGIQISLKKHSSSSARYQQEEGPAVARDVLAKYKLEDKFVDRVCYLIAHHHTYSAIDDVVFQIIVEADFLVNAVEDVLSTTQIESFYDKYFKTNTGKVFLRSLNSECI